MAKNRVFANARKLTLNWTTADSTGSDSDFQSGKPIMVGRMPGVVLVDSTGKKTVVDLAGAYKLTVFRGTTAAGAVGDRVFFTKTTRRVHLGNSTVAGFTSSEPPFGYLLTVVPSGVASTSSTGITVKIGAFAGQV